MSREQCLERAEKCFAIAVDKPLFWPTASKDKAGWLWLFMWAGMFECE